MIEVPVLDGRNGAGLGFLPTWVQGCRSVLTGRSADGD
jgi:hypothetical protein